MNLDTRMRRYFIALRIVLFFALTALVFSEAKAQTIRIMPLGNSITAGGMCTNGDIHSCVPLGGNQAVGYRLSLYNLLNAAGYSFDFVGTEQYGYSQLADSDCAGFGGIRDSQLADIMETGSSSHSSGYVTPGPYMETIPADIILLHIGTNDILGADTANADIDRILDAVDDYEAASGDTVMVFLARIISTQYEACGDNPRIVAYNRIIDNLAAARQAAGDHLIVVDMECNAGLDYDNDFTDQVHPNQSGYDKMGQAWFDAIDSWIKSMNITYELTMHTSGGGGLVSPSEGVHTYDEGTLVDLSATPIAGYEFSAWTGNLESSANPVTVTMDSDKSITATFAKLSYELTVSSDGTSGAGVSPTGTITVDHGDTTIIEVSYVPAGNEFRSWEVISGSSVSIGDTTALNTTAILESGNATLRANFRKIVKVSSLDYPDLPAKIGDIMRSTITVVNDQGEALSLVSGSIGGYALSNLMRIDSISYTADILIEEGGPSYLAEENIPVSKLVLSDGDLSSPVFNDTIVQNNDPIDAKAPVLLSLSVPDSVFGTGDIILMTVMADGEGCLAEPGTEINGVPISSSRLEFSEIASGEYLLSYTVDGLDSSVQAGQLQASVILRDEAGNISTELSEIEANSLEIIIVIDAITKTEQRELHISPNPARNSFYLGLENTSITGGSMEVFDIRGRCVISKDLSRNQEISGIDISHLDPGIYLVRFTNEFGETRKGKVIKTD